MSDRRQLKPLGSRPLPGKQWRIGATACMLWFASSEGGITVVGTGGVYNTYRNVKASG